MKAGGKNDRGTNTEYCGKICKQCKSGKYYYTGPIPELSKEEDFKAAEDQWAKLGKPLRMAGGCSAEKAPSCSKGDSHVANFHTHPDGSRLNDWDKEVSRTRGQDEYVGRDRLFNDSVDHFDPDTGELNSLETLPK
jgi:hypothetical protein